MPVIPAPTTTISVSISDVKLGKEGDCMVSIQIDLK
jgi:hypothetical protein